MTGRHTSAERDSWTPRQIQTEGARQRMHGPIVPMAYPRVPLWRRLLGRV